MVGEPLPVQTVYIALYIYRNIAIIGQPAAWLDSTMFAQNSRIWGMHVIYYIYGQKSLE